MRSRPLRPRLSLATCVALSLVTPLTQAETVKLAVAANFVDALNALIAAYKTAGRPYSSVATFTVTSGATGVLSGNISTALTAGVQTPYDLFFSADDTTPDKLRASFPQKVQVPYFYAQGYLILWSIDSER